MPAALFREALAQGLHQLVEPAEGFDLGLLLVGKEFLVEQAQPVLGQIDGVRARFLAAHDLNPLEGLGERLVEAVVVTLVLDQNGARQAVEVLNRHRPVRRGHAPVQRLHQM